MSNALSSRSTRAVWMLLLPLLIAIAPAQGESASAGDLMAALQRGGYVILMRHASSPSAAPDAAHTNSDNVHQERQLDEHGRSSARAMGEAFTRLKIVIGQVLSSPTYRALETVKVAGVGQPIPLRELGESVPGMSSVQRAAWLRARAAIPPAAGTNTLIVTHFPNIAEAFPRESTGLVEGEALILQTNERGEVSLVARVKIDEWPTKQ